MFEFLCLFSVPPSNVKIEVKFDEEEQYQMYAVCSVQESNPVCSVQFRGPREIIGIEKYSKNYSLPHGAWNTEYAVNLNVKKEDDGQDITCVVDCKELSTDFAETVSIQLPCKFLGYCLSIVS